MIWWIGSIFPGAVVAQDDVSSMGAGPSHCSFGPIAPTPLMVDDLPVYMAPMATAATETSLFLAGTPEYVWREDGPVTGSLFGVEMDSAGIARRVPPPIDGPVGMRWVVPRPGGGWLVVFAELDSTNPEPFTDPVAVWSAVWDGRWRDLRPVPVPDPYTLDHLGPADADLIQLGAETWFAMRVDPRDRLLMFRLESEGWVPLDGWRSGARVGWLTFTPDTTSSPILVYTQTFDLRRAKLSGAEQDERDLYAWQGRLTISGLQATMRGGALVVLINEEAPTVYIEADGGEVSRRRVDWVPSDSDVFLVVLPNREPAVIWQSRRLNGGAATLSVRSLTEEYDIVRHSVDSPFAALEDVVPALGGFYLAGTVFPSENNDMFVTAVAHVSVTCEVQHRK